jgi:hypothetical protein
MTLNLIQISILSFVIGALCGIILILINNYTLNKSQGSVIEVSEDEFNLYVETQQLKLFKKSYQVYSHENDYAIRIIEDNVYKIKKDEL